MTEPEVAANVEDRHARRCGSYRNLELALADPRGFDVEKAVDRVWACAPKPTPYADQMINQVIAKYADVAGPETQQAAADYMIENACVT